MNSILCPPGPPDSAASPWETQYRLSVKNVDVPERNETLKNLGVAYRVRLSHYRS